MNNFDFDYVPIYKFKDPSVMLRSIGKVLLWAVIPGLLALLALATQVNFNSNKWGDSSPGIFFLVSAVLTGEALLLGTIFYLVGGEFNRAPIRLTLFGADLILYFEKEIVKRFNLSEVINVTPQVLNLNKSNCKALLIEYPQGKRHFVLTQHIPDQYIEAIMAAMKYYKSIT